MHIAETLEVHANKCKIMLISRKRVHTIQPPNLALNGELLEHVTSYTNILASHLLLISHGIPTSLTSVLRQEGLSDCCTDVSIETPVQLLY